MPSDTQTPAETTPAETSHAIPTTPDAMKSWLLAGSYKSWTRESKAHASAGPHAASVLTFVDAELGESLASGGNEHPAGAAAVKEFFAGADGEVTGWAVAVKTNASSESGNGWYWYETFSPAPGKHGIEGQGAPVCVSCHLSGHDFFLSPYPLQ